MIICVEFDGSIVEYDYPRIGKPVPGAIYTLKELNKIGHQIILCTIRSGKELEDALKYLKKNKVKPTAVNENPNQCIWSKSNRVYANVYLNSAALGAPTKKYKKIKKKCLDWEKVQEYFLIEKERGF